VGSSTIDGASYGLDNAGNRTSKTDWLANVTSNYTYDPTYELTQVTQGTNTTESYSYDPVGNRLSSLGVASYAYNNSNELTSTPTTTYTFDNNGNTLSKTDSTGTMTYAWDYENRLTSVTLSGSGGTVSFKYDPEGRRIYKSSSLGTSIFAYDGNNIIEETNSSGAVVSRYSQGPKVDEPFAELHGGATNYYETDGLGSVTSLTNAAGAFAQTYAFDSFGKQTTSSGSATNAFHYTAREFDSETSLYYYRARYYDTQTGRFLSEDLIAADVNYYRYVTNRPTLESDPSGLFHVIPLPDNNVHVQDDIDASCADAQNPTGETAGGCNKVNYTVDWTGCDDCDHKPDFTITLTGDIYVGRRFPYKGRTPLDRSVVSTATALAHEQRHTDDKVNAIRPVFLLAERPYPTKDDCEAAAQAAAIQAGPLWNQAAGASQRRRH